MAANLVSIEGLQKLQNLQQLYIDWSALQTLDVSGLTNLTTVDASDQEAVETGDNCLTSINVTGCTALQYLRIDDSNFTEAGFPDLSSCTSLQYFDADQSGIAGSVNLSNFPALKGFDLGGNPDLTEIIISSTQPLGNGESVNLSSCPSLTQTALDNILQELASGSVSAGYVGFQNSVLPSFQRGVSAFRTLVVDKGWDYDKDSYYEALTTTDVWPTAAEACTALGNNETGTLYTYTGTYIQVGNYVYTDTNLLYPASDGFIAIGGDGSWAYEISGSNGLIVSQSACGV